LRVVVICSCPTTVLKVWGLYFRAETMNFSIMCPAAKVMEEGETRASL
jgi:hypothetical protein